jgi:S1-C subfamily serine protease
MLKKKFFISVFFILNIFFAINLKAQSNAIFNRLLDPVEGRWIAIDGAETTTLEIRKDGMDKFLIVYESSKDKFFLPLNKGAAGVYYGTVTNDKGKGSIQLSQININRIYFKISAKNNFGSEESKQAYFNRSYPLDFYSHNSQFNKSVGSKPSTGDSQEKPNDKQRKGASGSAFFINNKGNIVTNNHVIERCSGPVKVLYNKKEYAAKVIAKDGTLDLAVLNSDLKPNQYLKLSKKSGDKLDKVVAAGYPLGYKISDELKLTAGIVSATKGWKDNINEFQIDAALNPGNSGGPVVNDAGNLFGVAVAGLADRQNLNFAIKSKAVKDFLDVNKVSYSTATIEFDMDNKKRLKLLEDSTVFIYCN